MGVGLTVLFAGVALAQAPAGSTGECKDGTYTSNGLSAKVANGRFSPAR